MTFPICKQWSSLWRKFCKSCIWVRNGKWALNVQLFISSCTKVLPTIFILNFHKKVIQEASHGAVAYIAKTSCFAVIIYCPYNQVTLRREHIRKKVDIFMFSAEPILRIIAPNSSKYYEEEEKLGSCAWSISSGKISLCTGYK